MPSSRKSSTTPCAYLRLHLSLRELRNLCDALEVKHGDEDTATDLCARIQKERPDLMRGEMWNKLRYALRRFDLHTDNGLYALKHLLFFPYGMYENFTLLNGDPKTAVGHAKYALQRQNARGRMGLDTRPWFWANHMLNSPRRSTRKSSQRR